jgi:hypothetical protein
VIGISGNQRTVEIDRVPAVESFFCEGIEGLPTRTSQISIGYPERRKTAEVMSELRGARAGRLHRAMAVGRQRGYEGDSPFFATLLQFHAVFRSNFRTATSITDAAIGEALVWARMKLVSD